MNKEFKKIAGKKETRYVLESATGGATSSASVATGPTGKSGNLLVQGKDDKPVIQRRNPVAANVNAAVGGGGAGAHKDKSKTIPRKEKHKKDWRKEFEEGVAEGADLSNLTKDEIEGIYSMIKNGYTTSDVIRIFNGKPTPEQILSIFQQKQGVAEGWGMGGYATYAGTRHGRGVAELDSHYIDQENDMTSSDLKSLYKQAVKLRSLIQKMGDDTTLEPWQQAKIAKAADYVNAVFKNLDNDYGLDKIEEKIKGVDGKACWKGYRRMGTKKKGGKTVDNCVKVNEELDSDVHVPGFGVVPLEQLKNHVKTLSKDFNDWIQNDEFMKAAYNSEQFFNALLALAKALKQASTEKENTELAESPQFTSKKEVIDYFVSRGKPAAAGAAAWERGWRGPVKKPASSKKAKPANPPPEQGRLFAETADDEYISTLFDALSEAMMPASHFAGTPKNKLGPAAHLKGKMKRPARQGDLVGGSAEESYSKKKDIEEKLTTNDPIDVWRDTFLNANPLVYKQFRNKTPEKKIRMANRARFRAVHKNK